MAHLHDRRRCPVYRTYRAVVVISIPSKWERYILPFLFVCVIGANIAASYFAQYNQHQTLQSILFYITLFVRWIMEYGQAAVATIFVDSPYKDITLLLDNPANSIHYTLSDDAWRTAPGLISLGGIIVSLLFSALLIFGSVDNALSRFLLWLICGLLIHSTFWMDTTATEKRYLLLICAFIFGVFAAFSPRIGKAVLCLSLGIQVCLMNLWLVPTYIQKIVPTNMSILETITASFSGSAWLWGLLISMMYAFVFIYAIKVTLISSQYYFKFTE